MKKKKIPEKKVKIRSLVSKDEVLRLKALEEAKRIQRLLRSMLGLLVMVGVLSMVTSCRASKSGCRGKGSWYGNRNLGATSVDSKKFTLKVRNESCHEKVLLNHSYYDESEIKAKT
jgi:hypothetical protein